ncbi:MAG: DEAD/DEAH box helicase [Cyclobacteriaceae bacterium]|nr:DEAD/DEAH box helicase [Cyclobacteriaceae bacterium]
MKFEDFALDTSIIQSLEAMGFEKPTPIQEQAIPILLDHRDIIGCAQTGTGKTAAYLLPVIQHIAQESPQHINTLIIAPTRELALQIDQQLEGFAYFTPVSSIAIYGGRDGASFEREKKALLKGADIIIATPGKFIQHLNLGYVDLSHLKHFILDEADRMLDMGFFEDIMRIASKLPKQRQTLLFSATMPPKIRTMAKKILIDPAQINIAISKPAEGVFQAAFNTFDNQKVPLIEHLLTAKQVSSVLIFCSTKRSVKQIQQALEDLKFSVSSIHSDLDQSEREKVLLGFRNRQINVLVATDIVSRGIDIEDIGLIINYDVPRDAEDYVHRIGRTARAESTGTAITLINPDDQYKFRKIEKLIGRSISKGQLPEQLGPGPRSKSNPQRPQKDNFHRSKKGPKKRS